MNHGRDPIKRKASERAYRERNREKINAKNRLWRANNLEKSRTSVNRWYFVSQKYRYFIMSRAALTLAQLLYALARRWERRT
jgi:hypothetical protein